MALEDQIEVLDSRLDELTAALSLLIKPQLVGKRVRTGYKWRQSEGIVIDITPQGEVIVHLDQPVVPRLSADPPTSKAKLKLGEAVEGLL